MNKNQKKNREIYLASLFTYWCGIYKLPLPLLIRDNRMKYIGAVKKLKYTFNFLYSMNQIERLQDFDIMTFIFHELGHIKYPNKDRIKAEINAERFALRELKKRFPKYYEKQVKYTKRCLKQKSYFWKEKYPEHYEAFKRIKEYNE